MALIYIFKNLFNVWLNGKQLDSHIWFFILPCDTTFHIISGIFDSALLREWKWKSQTASQYSLNEFWTYRLPEKFLGTFKSLWTVFETCHLRIPPFLSTPSVKACQPVFSWYFWFQEVIAVVNFVSRQNSLALICTMLRNWLWTYDV